MPSTTTYILWHYTPSVVAAIIVAAVFLILSIGHVIFRLLRGSKPANILIAGGLFEIAGYAARAYAHFDTHATTPYAIQSLLILLAPILFAAGVYMSLSRVMYSTKATPLSPIPVKYITRIFVGGDITCFVIQGAGGGILSSAKKQSTVDLGNDVILAGLIVQIVLFLCFVVVASLFHARWRKNTSTSSPAATSSRRRPSQQQQLCALYVMSGLILLRNVYRMLEYALGQSGYLIRHEWTLYAFDAAPMIVVLAVAFVWHLPLGYEEDAEK